jgi:precorrin-3B C17-methyltransferase
MIFVVGIGPGGSEHFTGRAVEAIKRADTVVGYTYYIDLLGELVEGKKIVSTGMTREIDRCKSAVELALAGRDVAVVSTGDAGVYGMAGLVLELLEAHDPEGTVEVEVVPGVTAASAAASVLGAPLMTDFAVISLSDLLTPWEVIEKRLEGAAHGDFVVAIYNPRSKKRVTHLNRACEILGRNRSGDIPVGIVRNALREGQQVILTTLAEAAQCEVDMMSVVIVGNSATRRVNSRMVTPRGYPLDQKG